MGYKQFRCCGCHKLHRQRVAGQKYCSAQSCQKQRKNAWRREQYATDEEYRLCTRDSTRSWLEARGGAANYYRDYRQRRKLGQQTKPTSNEGSPSVSQKDLSASQSKSRGSGANSDAKNQQALVMTGKYLLVPMVPSGGANSDAIFIELTVITGEYGDLQRTTGCYWQQNEVKVEV
jgi:hypothetical protein